MTLDEGTEDFILDERTGDIDDRWIEYPRSNYLNALMIEERKDEVGLVNATEYHHSRQFRDIYQSVRLEFTEPAQRSLLALLGFSRMTCKGHNTLDAAGTDITFGDWDLFASGHYTPADVFAHKVGGGTVYHRILSGGCDAIPPLPSHVQPFGLPGRLYADYHQVRAQMEERISNGQALRSLPDFDLLLPEARGVIDQRLKEQEAQTHFPSLQYRGFEDRWTVSPHDLAVDGRYTIYIYEYKTVELHPLQIKICGMDDLNLDWCRWLK